MKTKQISVKEGILEGEEKTACMIFRGVPYAEAPVGRLRFKAPVPKYPWKGVRQALTFPAMCPQPDPTGGFYGKEFYTSENYPLPAQSEDCLYLNIWAPSMKRPGGYPVAVWIHGGAFDHGFSSEMEFDGETFAARDVILVTINYRVGVFGFFAHPDLKTDGVGNVGLLDQIQAVKWVKKNIAAFGGDPERITIFGQSAGAISVQALLCSPLAEGLISGAIMQSGGGFDNGLTRVIKPEDAYKTGRRIMDLCRAKNLNDMIRMPAEKFVSILPELYEQAGGLVFSPVIDGEVLKEDYDTCLKNGHVLDIPVMLGITADDITVEKGTDGRRSRFMLGCTGWADGHSRSSGKPVFVYYFKRSLPGDDAGAFHSSELWYVFGTLNRCWRPMTAHDYQLSDIIMERWTAFMKNGDPGKEWKPYSKGNFVRVFM